MEKAKEAATENVRKPRDDTSQGGRSEAPPWFDNPVQRAQLGISSDDDDQCCRWCKPRLYLNGSVELYTFLNWVFNFSRRVGNRSRTIPASFSTISFDSDD